MEKRPVLLRQQGLVQVRTFPRFTDTRAQIVAPSNSCNRLQFRIEMFFAAHVPLRADIHDRACKFQSGLRYAVSCGRRPHLLFGTREAAGGRYDR